ncbi:putative methyltransferase-domain-containing protein [Dunaliella salina]|uniref:Methyltransferase-domain-containing protein n=1 Tax=Dunaliella salina TaxID=3046 RepID=A0ABQ7GHE6_DUNSA|nr:putative methyltransferase-domain-containing protein [Dunaliella salina]|eukprot:KAF5834016.1 putative methyltransferase-domain-containing protein [Dunaliella salina]
MRRKRSHLPDRDRFRRPYIHDISSCSPPITLRLKQAKFAAQGFASTIWDSSIVLSRYIERHASHFRGKRCLDLSAGCGLVGITLAVQGAEQVVATDLPPNIPLLHDNCQQNVPGKVEVLPFTWGEDPSLLQPPFDVIVACDVMYIAEAVDALVTSLRDLCHPAVGGAHAKLDQTSHKSGDASAPSCQSHAMDAHSKKRLAAQGVCGSSSSKRKKGEAGGRAGEVIKGQRSHAAHSPTAIQTKRAGPVGQQSHAAHSPTALHTKPAGPVGQQSHAAHYPSALHTKPAGPEGQQSHAAHYPSAVQTKPAGSDGKREPASPEGQQSRAAQNPSAVQTQPAGLERRMSSQGTEILIAHGINRTAEAAFLEKASQHFSVSAVPPQEQHPDFHSSDVAVYRLVPL